MSLLAQGAILSAGAIVIREDQLERMVFLDLSQTQGVESEGTKPAKAPANIIDSSRLGGDVKAKALHTQGGHKEELEGIGQRKWSCKISSDLAWKMTLVT